MLVHGMIFTRVQSNKIDTYNFLNLKYISACREDKDGSLDDTMLLR